MENTVAVCFMCMAEYGKQPVHCFHCGNRRFRLVGVPREKMTPEERAKVKEESDELFE